LGPPAGLDPKALRLDGGRKHIFDPQTVRAEKEASRHFEKAAAAAPPPPRPNLSLFPDIFPWFGEVTTPSGKYGFIRIKTFAPATASNTQAAEEFARILQTLPQTGLILDVRGNGGGFINIGERILQMLTPHPIVPEPFHFLATPLTLKIASEQPNGLEQWKDTIVQGLESGASFSQGFPLTPLEDCNAIGQIYQGPVVLITNALCYSTTDIFSAGFQDHKVGTILGCHSSTGAGGANVWDYTDLMRSLSLDNPFVGLPGGARMRVAARRCTRVGDRSGIPVEDYGVTSDIRYFMTRADVMGFNHDMIAAAAAILNAAPKQSLRVTADAADPRKISVDCSNIERIDLFLNGRPGVSQEVSGIQTGLAVTLPFAVAAGNVLS